MKMNFAFIGVASYIAPRHFYAIKSLKHNLVISYDIHDNVGILDRYFPDVLHFNKFDKFQKEFMKLKKKIDYLVIATPNYLHYRYIKFGLENKIQVICEKPLVISFNHMKQIEQLEIKYRTSVFNILQIRTLKVVKNLKKKINKGKFYNVNINYITPRGHWYQSSWKGKPKKSGGLLFNIGIHLIDLVCYLFGDYKSYKMFRLNDKIAKGQILFNNAEVNFYLSIDRKDLSKDKNKKVIRDFIINNRKIDLVKNFDQAHIDCYKEIINKKKFNLNSVKKSIFLASKLKNALL